MYAIKIDKCENSFSNEIKKCPKCIKGYRVDDDG